MKLFNKVAIIGVGLIGGSIGLAIKKKRIARQVIGIGRHKVSLRTAIKLKAIDSGSLDYASVAEADLIILSTPVESIIDIGSRIKPFIKTGAVVIDTGSSKELIVRKLSGIIPGFVGTHPLAGLEKRGVANARHDLFTDSICVLTPTPRTSKSNLGIISKFWTGLGARVIYLNPVKHDKFMSYVSHMPHIVASALIQSVPRNCLHLASGGLRDTTRIAASAETVWKDIILTNSGNVLRALDDYILSLSEIKAAIKKQDAKLLKAFLKQARLKRQGLNLK